jgi:hypothetical protein
MAPLFSREISSRESRSPPAKMLDRSRISARRSSNNSMTRSVPILGIAGRGRAGSNTRSDGRRYDRFLVLNSIEGLYQLVILRVFR